MAHNYSPKIVTDGLIFYVDAANTKSYVSGSTIWNDLSKTFTTTNLFNTPLYTSTNNGGIVFDGINEYGETPRLTVLRPDYVTMCAWVKYTGTQALSFVGGYGNTGTAGYSLYINCAGGNPTNFGFIAGNGNTISGGTPSVNFGTPGVSTINYICGTFDGSVLRGYQNGVLRNTVTQPTPGPLVYPTTGSSPVTGGLHIGIIVSSLAAARYWTGNIYQIKIYNRALSTTEILQNYNTTKTRFGL
jgi:hypothetical protein